MCWIFFCVSTFFTCLESLVMLTLTLLRCVGLYPLLVMKEDGTLLHRYASYVL